jgi:hypothetical protein
MLYFLKYRIYINKTKLNLFLKLSYSAEAVLTYKISKKEVGIIINNAVAISPRIFTSIIKIL